MADEPVLFRYYKFRTLFKLLKGNFSTNFSKIKTAVFSGNFADLTNPEKTVAVYIGHATVFINFFGTTILTDPNFSSRTGWIVRRKITPGLSLRQIPALDFILVSHPHLDHFDRPSLLRLAPKTKTLIIPKNSSDLVADLGFAKVIESHWGENLLASNLQIHTFKPQHWGTRLLWEKNGRGYNSYILTKNEKSLLFAGDSGYTKNFAEATKGYSIDIAFLPISAYNPPEFRAWHMHPEDAVKVFLEIKAKYLIPVHWGTFRLSLELLEEPPQLLQELMNREGLGGQLKILPPGDFFEFLV